MATLPRATTSVDAASGGSASGSNILTLIGPVQLNGDGRPRRFSSAKAVFDYHGYSEVVEYIAIHTSETGQPVVVCGVPIETSGAVGARDTTGGTGTSVVTITAGADGVLNEHDGVVTVESGGTIGSSQIVLGLSLDGGRTVKKVRLGTGNSYTIPYVGVQLSFGAGTLVTGDTIATWHGSQPQCDSAGVQLAREKLAESSVQSKTWLVISDAQSYDFAAAVLTQAQTYDTSSDRFVAARVQTRDRLQYAALSKTEVRSSASTVTFAEVGATGDTITRASGSFVADGFAVGQMITVSDTPSGTNNFTGAAKLTAVSALVLTLDTDDLAAQGPVAATIVGEPSVTFANAADTLTRSSGSWLDDGFRVGMSVTVAGGHASNNGAGKVITTLTATVMTLASGGVGADHVARVGALTITAGETKTDWLTSVEDAFEDIDGAYEINLGLGRGRKLSPFTGYMYRRPVQWAACVREFQHDYHVASWKKDEGPLTGWTIEDEDGNLAEYDDRVDGAFASAARFTSFRTWSNGPAGVAISLDLTRAEDGNILSYAHNVAVTNLARSVVQQETESAIGSSLTLNADGTATADSLKTIARSVNGALSRKVVVNVGEGTRCSSAVWTPATDDNLSGAEALLNGTLDLVLNGTLHSINTVIKVH
jgi:hypothetical protein